MAIINRTTATLNRCATMLHQKIQATFVPKMWHTILTVHPPFFGYITLYNDDGIISLSLTISKKKAIIESTSTFENSLSIEVIYTGNDIYVNGMTDLPLECTIAMSTPFINFNAEVCFKHVDTLPYTVIDSHKTGYNNVCISNITTDSIRVQNVVDVYGANTIGFNVESLFHISENSLIPESSILPAYHPSVLILLELPDALSENDTLWIKEIIDRDSLLSRKVKLAFLYPHNSKKYYNDLINSSYYSVITWIERYKNEIYNDAVEKLIYLSEATHENIDNLSVISSHGSIMRKIDSLPSMVIGDFSMETKLFNSLPKGIDIAIVDDLTIHSNAIEKTSAFPALSEQKGIIVPLDIEDYRIKTILASARTCVIPYTSYAKKLKKSTSEFSNTLYTLIDRIYKYL